MENICLQSQGLTEVPSSIYEKKVDKLNLQFNDIVSLPLELCTRLQNLTFLALNGNMLETLPTNIGLLKGLTDLYLKENCLVTLPDSIVELQNLQRLRLTGNNIQKLPENIGLLENLNELAVDENAIKYLPCSFGNLKLLSDLDLSYNDIESLSDNFGNLESLKYLNLSNNSIYDLPNSFCLLPCVEILDLTLNKISYLPPDFKSAHCLNKLLLAKNRLSEIPMWFTKMKSIKVIFLSENNLHEAPFPEDFGMECVNLEQLDLSGNNVTTLPESIGKLENLISLDLGSSFDELERNRMISNGNDIELLPGTICDLKCLSKLELDENQLQELPHNFGLLSNLTYLDLSHNLLHSLPDSFCQLKTLKVCLLSMNFLASLPESFGMLEALEELKLDHNKLEQLPGSFTELSSIKFLDLYMNNLKEFPDVLKQLKSLKSLDLRENAFGSTLDALAIICKPTYQIRDPAHADNWRGRKRLDIQPGSWVEKKTGDSMNKEHLENDFLCNAMYSASSLWRKHGQADTRSKKLVTQEQTSNEVNGYLENGDLNKYDERSASEDLSHDKQTINHESDKSLKKSFQDRTSDADVSYEKETEYWDEDVQSNASRSSSLSYDEKIVPEEFEDGEFEQESERDFPKNFTRTYQQHDNGLPPEINELFIPSDLHISSARDPEMWDIIEDGQFDDADS